MQKTKISKKELREMVNGSMREALERLQLPKASKRVKKLLDKSSRKIASEYADLLRRERKRQKKSNGSHTYVEDLLIGKKKARKQAAAASADAPRPEPAHA